MIINGKTYSTWADYWESQGMVWTGDQLLDRDGKVLLSVRTMTESEAEVFRTMIESESTRARYLDEPTARAAEHLRKPDGLAELQAENAELRAKLAKVKEILGSGLTDFWARDTALGCLADLPHATPCEPSAEPVAADRSPSHTGILSAEPRADHD